MTRPISESNDRRDQAQIDYELRQTARRPSPSSAGSAAATEPVWVAIFRDPGSPVTITTGFTGLSLHPDDGNNSTLISDNAAGQIDVVVDDFGPNPDALVVTVGEPGIITVRNYVVWAGSGSSPLTATLVPVRAGVFWDVIPTGIFPRAGSYSEINNASPTISHCLDTQIVFQEDIDEANDVGNNAIYARGSQQSGGDKTAVSILMAYWLPLEAAAASS